jgi:hypothetical protein
MTKRFKSDTSPPISLSLVGRVELTREQIMLFSTGNHIAAVLPLPDLAIRVLDVNTVQITYNSSVTYDGVAYHSRRSSIWSRFEERWVMRFHQGTPYAEA